MNLYLERYAYPQQLIFNPPDENLGLVIVIPCHNEPNLIDSLEALRNCAPPKCSVEVIVIINEAENCTEAISRQNQATFQQATGWISNNYSPGLIFYLHHIRLPEKHAGVGFARKIGMDEAVRRFEAISKQQDGAIVCFDADSLCQANYLTAIEEHFQQHPKTPGCSIYYEHPLEGSFSADVYQGIIKYELFLRYYVDALRYAGFPHAFQTIGSSMAVRSAIYQEQGGMNRRKAGEDFYFLHKIIPLGGFTELSSTAVIPSPRPSDRVPFGTGKAIGDWLNNPTAFYPAYHPQTFIDLKFFLSKTDALYKISGTSLTTFLKDLPSSIQSFLFIHNFTPKVTEINGNSVTINSFRNRFFRWMNGFRVLKYVHYARDKYYAPVDIVEAAQWLLKEFKESDGIPENEKDLLQVFRKADYLKTAFKCT